MSYSGNLFLPNFIRYNKLTNKSYDLKKTRIQKKYLDNL